MPLVHPRTPRVGKRNLSLGSVFVGEGLKPVPRNELPADGIDPDMAYQIVHDELLLDGKLQAEPGDLRQHLDGAAGPGALRGDV